MSQRSAQLRCAGGAIALFTTQLTIYSVFEINQQPSNISDTPLLSHVCTYQMTTWRGASPRMTSTSRRLDSVCSNGRLVYCQDAPAFLVYLVRCLQFGAWPALGFIPNRQLQLVLKHPQLFQTPNQIRAVYSRGTKNTPWKHSVYNWDWWRLHLRF